ncbi:DUF2254 domain-containing protein [Mesobacterium sp. TK19101]|uniref:DUF2254 domain-containing protein n=1 Tax=Mesobacterium hydrothermale TaxID=3111907 RepID=A0ABU6HJT6_9RHOB|nr:DUF2254 domain-containing protein [Mesobacterium sp. TK19101]MEC3862712.1 DUF2254 domain-containing protein [Mesobacterium sp. TK19101]
MLSKSLMLVLRLWHTLAVRVLLLAVLALLAVVLAPVLEPVIPKTLRDRFNQQAVLPILTILASSMLAVTTFSLGVMVQAFRAASSQATPRAYRILIADPTTQNVLATFTGAFLFALSAIVMFRAGYYGSAASVVVFALTVFAIAGIIVAILRWIDHLSRLGSMDHTLHMAEEAARAPLTAVIAQPCLGGVAQSRIPETAKPVKTIRAGYVQFIDIKRLQALMEAHDARFHLRQTPGDYVMPGAVLGLTDTDAVDTQAICACFTLGKTRSMEQDARFGLLVLNEIGTRALSSGVNDPGTAIDVIHRMTALLLEAGGPKDNAPLFDRVTVPPLQARSLIEDGYFAMIRCGANQREVVDNLLSALTALAHGGWDDLSRAADDARNYALSHARAALRVQQDKDWLERQ